MTVIDVYVVAGRSALFLLNETHVVLYVLNCSLVYQLSSHYNSIAASQRNQSIFAALLSFLSLYIYMCDPVRLNWLFVPPRVDLYPFFFQSSNCQTKRSLCVIKWDIGASSY